MSEHQSKILYKKDSKGEIRVWWMELNYDKNAHRTCSGLEHGLVIDTNWTRCKSKNVGKSNETTPGTQASAEVDAKYEVKLGQGYAWTVEALEEITIFKPMLAQKYNDFVKKNKKFDYENGVFTQPKLDGIRCLPKFKKLQTSLWTRTGKPITSCEHVRQGMLMLFAGYENCVFDGELYNHDLKDDFNQITSLVRKVDPNDEERDLATRMVQYHIYDMYDPRHPDAPFLLRKMELDHIFSKIPLESDIHNFIKKVPTRQAFNEADIDKQYIDYLDAGYEGQMVRTNTKYMNTRSWGLLKRKEFTDAEFTIIDIMEGKGNWSGYAKRVAYKMMPSTKDHTPDPRLKALADGEPTIFEGGVAGNQAFCKKLLKEKDQYIGGQVTVTYFQPTPDGIPRFPVAKAFFKKGQQRND
jgi:DNA ligase-1